jgi:dynein heavy chain
MRGNLSDLINAINGVITMSANLESIYYDIFNGFIPDGWKKLAPQTLKRLASWILYLTKRTDQFNEWIKGEPALTWISGIHVPYSYLIALNQQ